MSIAQASAGAAPDTLIRVSRALGVGNLRGPRTPPSAWTKLPQYVWVARSFEDVQFATAAVWRWLGPVKRAQASEALLRYRSLAGHGRSTAD
jgi:hypothetical protein